MPDSAAIARILIQVNTAPGAAWSYSHTHSLQCPGLARDKPSSQGETSQAGMGLLLTQGSPIFYAFLTHNCRQ